MVEVTRTLGFGLACVLAWWLGRSTVSRQITTALVERPNGTDRRQNGRKQRKTYGLSKDGETHNAATDFYWLERQLLLAGENLGAQSRSGEETAPNARDGGGPGRPRLDPPGMVDLPRQTLLANLTHHRSA